jgi:hypothetical protein
VPGYFVVRIDVTPVIAGPTLALLAQIQANGTRRVAAANIPADPTV